MTIIASTQTIRLPTCISVSVSGDATLHLYADGSHKIFSAKISNAVLRGQFLSSMSNLARLVFWLIRILLTIFSLRHAANLWLSVGSFGLSDN